jgi:hypothetical protein
MSYIERDKILSVRVSQELLDKLDEKANFRNCTRTDYVLAILGQDLQIEIEPPKLWGEERIIALEKKLAQLEKKTFSYDDIAAIAAGVVRHMKATGELL